MGKGGPYQTSHVSSTGIRTQRPSSTTVLDHGHHAAAPTCAVHQAAAEPSSFYTSAHTNLFYYTVTANIEFQIQVMVSALKGTKQLNTGNSLLAALEVPAQR